VNFFRRQTQTQNTTAKTKKKKRQKTKMKTNGDAIVLPIGALESFPILYSVLLLVESGLTVRVRVLG
jgi:hypothetical protein